MALSVLRRRASGQDAALERGDRSTLSTGLAAKDQAGSGSSPERWIPWAELADLHERMGRLLAEPFGSVLRGADDLLGGWRPAADVEKTDEAYVVELELPGVKRDDVTVEFGGGELSVTGEVKQEERVGFLRKRTRPVGRFDYRISLPAEVQEDQVTASLADGVLTVRVPKTERARRRKIAISAG